jgi:hypothetical protein
MRSFKVGAEKDPHLRSATPCFQGNTASGLMRVIRLSGLVSRKAVWLAGIVKVYADRISTSSQMQATLDRFEYERLLVVGVQFSAFHSRSWMKITIHLVSTHHPSITQFLHRIRGRP